MKNIYQALLKAQREIDAAVKDSNNPHFRSKYESLESVIEAIKDPLNKAGILIAHTTNELSLSTKLIHAESGEFVETTSPLLMSKQDMQQFGSACTYAKRQNLKNLTNLPSEDDDGNSVSGHAPINTKAALQGAKTEASQTSNPDATPEQYTMIKGLKKGKKLSELSVEDCDKYLNYFTNNSSERSKVESWKQHLLKSEPKKLDEDEHLPF